MTTLYLVFHQKDQWNNLLFAGDKDEAYKCAREIDEQGDVAIVYKATEVARFTGKKELFSDFNWDSISKSDADG